VTTALFGQVMLKGKVIENDSTAMPFVYIINKSSGNGTMSDHEGRFSLLSSSKDTLVCSFVGFFKLVVPVKDLARNSAGEVRLKMTPMPVNLAAVTVSAFRLKVYEREYMNDIIDRSKIQNISYFSSPITALYMRYSKEGKQIRKLAQIFEDVMREELVQKKLSREILVKLTGDENIDYAAFRKYWYFLNDYFSIENEGVELYSKVMDCYKRYKSEGRTEPLKRREQQ